MRIVKGLLALGLIGTTVAACAGDTGYYGNSYPSQATAYGYPTSAYYPTSGYNRGTYANNGYHATNTTSARVPRPGPNGDYDRDGIPNRYDRDANGDGVPDRWQR